MDAYWMEDGEVTQQLYELVMGTNPSHFQGPSKPPASGEIQERRPVENVSWFDAIAFCNELTRCCYSLGEAQCVYTYNGHTYTVEDAQDKKEPVMDMNKKGFRLPTEAEWEWAAQSGPKWQSWAGTSFPDEVVTCAWYDKNSYGLTHHVGRLKKNLFGLFDMSGNVWEWCWDWYTSTTPAGGTDPVGPPSGTERSTRGASYAGDHRWSRCAYRYLQEPDENNKNTGFRIVCRYEF